MRADSFSSPSENFSPLKPSGGRHQESRRHPMASKVETTESGAIRATLPSAKPTKNLKDYFLSGIDFSTASNGVIAKCRFRMKREVLTKMEEATKGRYVDYDIKNHEENYVFEGFDAGQVSEFLVQAMTEFKSSKGKS